MSERKALIAGNWKMNGLKKDGDVLAQEIAKRYANSTSKKCDVLICPPFTFLAGAVKVVAGSGVS